jgi:hypothetical protein
MWRTPFRFRLPLPSKVIRPRLAAGFGVPEMVVDPDSWNAYGPTSFAGLQTSSVFAAPGSKSKRKNELGRMQTREHID